MLTKASQMVGPLKGALPIVYGDGWTQAVRYGDWKAYRTNQEAASIKLFNLTADIGETTDVAAHNAQVVAMIVTIMEREHTPNPMWPSANSTHPRCCMNCFSTGGKGCPAPCGGLPSPPALPSPLSRVTPQIS